MSGGTTDRDHAAVAEALIADVVDDPPARALRIAGIYAAFFLEEPFTFSWGGISCFVSAYLRHVLAVTTTPIEDGVMGGDTHALIATINLDIYRNILPSYLQFRDDLPVTGRVAPGLARMRQAERALLTDMDEAVAGMHAALLDLCFVEQRDIAQPHFADLPVDTQVRFTPFYLFRLGADSAAPVLRFTGDNPCNFAQRWAWTERQVIPAWLHVWRSNGQWLRAEADRVRRRAGVKLVDLPVRRGAATEP